MCDAAGRLLLKNRNVSSMADAFQCYQHLQSRYRASKSLALALIREVGKFFRGLIAEIKKKMEIGKTLKSYFVSKRGSFQYLKISHSHSWCLHLILACNGMILISPGYDQMIQLCRWRTSLPELCRMSKVEQITYLKSDGPANSFADIRNLTHSSAQQVNLSCLWKTLILFLPGKEKKENIITIHIMRTM